MTTALTPSAFESINTIVFLNKSHAPPSVIVWVAENREAHAKAMSDLRGMAHCEIIQHGPSHVVRNY